MCNFAPGATYTIMHPLFYETGTVAVAGQLRKLISQFNISLYSRQEAQLSRRDRATRYVS